MSTTRPGRPARFSREQIAKVAFAIADSDGFENLSMRRVAQEMGSGTMTLYHYVRTKDELVALMDDQAMGDLLLDGAVLDGPWREAFGAILRRTYQMRIAHPWSLVALQNAPLGENARRHHDQTLMALAHAPFDDAQRLLVITVADSFVDGHALRTAELAGREPIELRAWAAGPRNPHPAVAPEDGQPSRREVAAWMEAAFEAGMEALLDGLEIMAAKEAGEEDPE